MALEGEEDEEDEMELLLSASEEDVADEGNCLRSGRPGRSASDRTQQR